MTKPSNPSTPAPLPPVLDEHGNPLAAAPAKPQGTAKGKAAGKRHHKRFEVLNAFVDATMADLTRAEMAVWLVLFRDTKDGTARTSYQWIAERAGVSPRSVSSALGSLKTRGLLKVVHAGGLRRGPSRYAVKGVKP